MLNQKAGTEVQPRAKFNGLLVIVCNKWTLERSGHCLWNEWKWLFNYASAAEVVCSQATFKPDVGKIKTRVFVLGALGFGWNSLATLGKGKAFSGGYSREVWICCHCLLHADEIFAPLLPPGCPSPPWLWGMVSPRPLQFHKLRSSCSGGCVGFEEG